MAISFDGGTRGFPEIIQGPTTRVIKRAKSKYCAYANIDADDVEQTVCEVVIEMLHEYGRPPEADELHDFEVELAYMVFANLRQQAAQVSFVVSGNSRDMSRSAFAIGEPITKDMSNTLSKTPDNLADIIVEIISSLPNNVRRVMELRYITGMPSDTAIGDLLGMKRRDVTRKRHRGEKMLKKILLRDYGEIAPFGAE